MEVQTAINITSHSCLDLWSKPVLVDWMIGQYTSFKYMQWKWGFQSRGQQEVTELKVTEFAIKAPRLKSDLPEEMQLAELVAFPKLLFKDLVLCEISFYIHFSIPVLFFFFLPLIYLSSLIAVFLPSYHPILLFFSLLFSNLYIFNAILSVLLVLMLLLVLIHCCVLPFFFQLVHSLVFLTKS